MSSEFRNGETRRRQISGLLEFGPRGHIVVTEAGDRWVLDRDECDSDLIGRQVTVEGVLVGLDRLKVDWVGEAQV